MKKVEFEYEIGLGLSQKNNQVVQLKIISNGITRIHYGKAALLKVKKNVYMFGKETHKYITGLKIMTDELYLSSNK